MNATDRLILDGARDIPEPPTLPAPGASYYGDHRHAGHTHAVAVRLAARDLCAALASVRAVQS